MLADQLEEGRALDELHRDEELVLELNQLVDIHHVRVTKKRTESGLVFLELTPGSGPKPEPANRVSVHYEGRLPDGTVFDSTNRQGLPRTFGLDQMIPGWTEGLLMMHGGGKAKLTIPAKLAYGRKGKKRKIPRCATLTFEIELLGIYD